MYRNVLVSFLLASCVVLVSLAIRSGTQMRETPAIASPLEAKVSRPASGPDDGTATPSMPASMASAAAASPPREAGPRAEPARREVPGIARDAWKKTIGSPDPALRAQSVDSIPREVGSRGMIEWILENDPDAYVRERAVLAFGETVLRAGIPTLRRLALEDPVEQVRDAALASLDLIDQIEPAPSRGWLELHGPAGAFDPSAPFTIRARFSSEQNAERAILAIFAPDGVELLQPGAPLCKLPVAAGQIREISFTFRFQGAPPRRARFSARLKLDFEERLDVELVERALFFGFDSRAARLTEVRGPGGKPEVREPTIERDGE